MDLRAVEFAHDLKMPIQLIYSCVQLLEMEVQRDSKAEGYLKMLMQSAHQLQRMVTSALDDDRMQYGCGLRLAELDVVDLARDVCRQAALFAREKRIEMGFFADAEEFRMHTDAEKLQRILHNLLSNALRFTPEDGRISLCVRIAADAMEISVSDTGCGIAESKRERIFERRYSEGGYGHGLAIVREYTAALGGSVSVHPNADGGSCFVLRLPIQK